MPPAALSAHHEIAESRLKLSTAAGQRQQERVGRFFVKSQCRIDRECRVGAHDGPSVFADLEGLGSRRFGGGMVEPIGESVLNV